MGQGGIRAHDCAAPTPQIAVLDGQPQLLPVRHSGYGCQPVRIRGVGSPPMPRRAAMCVARRAQAADSPIVVLVCVEIIICEVGLACVTAGQFSGQKPKGRSTPAFASRWLRKGMPNEG